jgi:hypothetical protein
MGNSIISGVSPIFQAIKQRIIHRWNEVDIHPLPTDDREGQALFFAGMADEAEKTSPRPSEKR